MEVDDDLNQWCQKGQIYIWRYDTNKWDRKGWHFSGDRKGCLSFLDLLARLRNKDDQYRTWKLAPLPENAWRVPNYGRPRRDRFDRLRVNFDREATSLSFDVEGEMLILSLGPESLEKVVACFTSVSIGEGDFGISPDPNDKEPPWMFWWY